MWACFPLYFHVLARAGAVEIVAHRFFWALVFCLAGVTILRQWGRAQAIWADRRLVGQLVLAGALVSLNWLIYIWAVINGRVVDAALGYFINPLVTVALGLVFLRERLHRLQYLALGVGLIAVIALVVGYGEVPWVGLSLALTFGLYALVKNRVGPRATPLVALGYETLVLGPVAGAYIAVLQATGVGLLAGHSAWYSAGLPLTGVVTAVPLLFFAAASARLPLATIGLLQYLTPVGQFLLGWLAFHEAMPLERWIGFAIVWVALVLLTIDALRHVRRRA
jgi:chloramphenicol-sensitive protein RarD